MTGVIASSRERSKSPSGGAGSMAEKRGMTWLVIGLATVAAGAVALSLFLGPPRHRRGEPPGKEPAVDKTGFIDAHVHIWTDDVQRYPLFEGRSKNDPSPPSFTPEELFRHAKPAGV